MKKRLFKISTVVVPFLGPVIFEIVNCITGDWINDQGKLNFTVGKLITSLIGIGYIIYMIIVMIKQKNWDAEQKKLENSISRLNEKNEYMFNTLKSMSTILAYTEKLVKDQTNEFICTKEIDTSHINLIWVVTTVCTNIYNVLGAVYKSEKFTVNIYVRENKDGKEYANMAAHEGQVSDPSVFGQMHLLKKSKNMRFSDKILYNNKPDRKIFINRQQVARAFGEEEKSCKYNQYIGIPIRKYGEDNIALIEIVVHNSSIIWNSKEDAECFAILCCDIFKEYLLLVDRIQELDTTIKVGFEDSSNEGGECNA